MNGAYHDDPVEIEPSQKRQFTAKLALLLTFISGSYFLQTTFAANVSLSSSGSVEFGQGVLRTVSCSGSDYTLSLTPNSTFVNASGGGAHYFSSVTVSNIPVNCHGKDFTINAYGSTGNSPLAMFNATSTSAVVISAVGSPTATSDQPFN